MKQKAISKAVTAALAGTAAKNDGPDTVKAKAEAARAAEAFKVRMEEVAPVAQVIAEAIGGAEDAQENVWAFIRDARLSGYSFDELEAVSLKGLPEVQGRKGMRSQTLKDLPRYRKAKQRIVGLTEAGKVLAPDMSSYEAEQAVKKPKATGSTDDADASETESNPDASAPLRFTDKLSVIKAALQTLLEDGSMRATFRLELADVAKKVRDDANAETAETATLLKKAVGQN